MAPWKIALAGAGLVLVAAFAPTLLHWALTAPGASSAGAPRSVDAAARDAPWSMKVDAEGHVRVFGLTVGRDDLQALQRRAGDGLLVGLVAAVGEVGSLEAMADPLQAGEVTGRLVASFEVDSATQEGWRSRSTGSQPMEGGVRRFDLAPADRAAASRARIAALTFIPAARLTAADVTGRFGPAPQREALADGVERLAWPDRRLTIDVAAGKRPVMTWRATAG